MEWKFWDFIVILFSIGWIGTIVYAVMVGLKIKNGPVAAMTGRIRPMIATGKRIGETGKRELEQNKERWQALAAQVKGIAESLRPKTDPTGTPGLPQARISYRTLLTGFALLRTLRRGWGQVQTARKPTSNPPGPPKAKKKARPRTLGAIPEIVHLLLDVRRALR